MVVSKMRGDLSPPRAQPLEPTCGCLRLGPELPSPDHLWPPGRSDPSHDVHDRGSRRMVWRGASGTGDGSWNSLPDSSAWDVHKDTIVVAVTAAGDGGKATPYGTFPNTVPALEKLVKRLRQGGSGPLKFCY